MTNTVSDDEMDEYLKLGNANAIRNAALRDPQLIQRGWRNGNYSWVMSACLFETYQATIPVLIELGADIDAGGHAPKENALYGAVVDSDIAKTGFLLQLGASVRIRPDLVWSAVVVRRHQLELVKMLDQFGADIHYIDEGGFSGRYANPLSLAKDYELDDVVAYLAANDGNKIWLYRMSPLYTEERQLEIDQGLPALLNAFDANDTSMIVDLARKNVALP